MREEFGERVETLSVSAENGGTLKTSKGTELEIEPNSFVNADGSAVTGTVEIELTQFMTLSQLALALAEENPSPIPMWDGFSDDIQQTQTLNGENE